MIVGDDELTPLSPRAMRPSRSRRQSISASEVATSQPSTRRLPEASIPMAMSTAQSTILPSRRTFSSRASRKRQGTSPNGRSRQAFSSSSSRAAARLTWALAGLDVMASDLPPLASRQNHLPVAKIEICRKIRKSGR